MEPDQTHVLLKFQTASEAWMNSDQPEMIPLGGNTLGEHSLLLHYHCQVVYSSRIIPWTLIKLVTRSAFKHLRNIAKMWHFNAERIVQAIISCRLIIVIHSFWAVQTSH